MQDGLLKIDSAVLIYVYYLRKEKTFAEVRIRAVSIPGVY